jgi:D-glycero-alpha-D-manno-heptose-7-phosphate kinase
MHLKIKWRKNLIISKTPFRISFFGGGTDYKDWYTENGGKFLSMGIDKYCYLNCRDLPPFFSYNNRIVWSKIEQVLKSSEIVHPTVRNCLEVLKMENLEIQHNGDLPARSGLGSSSSFCVGLLNALHRMQGKNCSHYELAKQAIEIERVIMNEAGGIQDQIAVSYGGLNYVNIKNDGDFSLEKIILEKEKKSEFEHSLMLVFTGVFRNSFEIAEDKIKNITKRSIELENISRITNEAKNSFASSSFLRDFGGLLNETWHNKKKLSSKVSNNEIDEIYKTAIDAGAYGGKLLGAGSGGFMVFVVPKSNRINVENSLAKLIKVPIRIDDSGSTIIHETNNI